MASPGNTKNILLVYPETPQDSYWSFSQCLGIAGKKACTPPLGLLSIAGMLPAGEFTLRLVDMNVSELPDKDIEWADAVFFSAMIAQKSSLETELKRVKAFGKTTVAGGPYSSSAYQDLANVDVFVIGEAEGTWPEFLADLRGGCLKPAYAAPVRQQETDALRAYFGDDAYIVPSASYPDVNLAPLPRFDLLELDKYAVMAVQASRGCPVGCEFCDIWRRYGRKTRVKTPERILTELDELYRLGWRDSVFLVDDNFIGNRAHAKKTLAELVAWQRQRQWPFSFVTEATLSVADDAEMLDLMEEAGFSSIFVGIETPAEASLRETGKYINLSGSMLEKAVRIQSRGIQLMSGFILGFDADPEDIAERMTACIQELGIPQAMIGLLNALPDTDLYDRLSVEQRISTQSTGNNTHDFAMNFQPKRPVADVLRDYKQVLEHAYSADMKSYFYRCSVLRERWPRKRSLYQSQPLGWKLKVAVKYLCAVAASSYRFNALRFIAKTVMVKPSFLEQAIELGVKGHHHWVITRQAFEIDTMRTTLSSRLRFISDYVQESLATLDAACGKLLPNLDYSGENAIEGVLSFLRALKEIQASSAQTSAVRKKIEEVAKRIWQYGRRIQKQTEKEYRRLSRAARVSLADDMERFFVEVNELCVMASNVRRYRH